MASAQAAQNGSRDISTAGCARNISLNDLLVSWTLVGGTFQVHLKNLGNLKSKGFLNFDFREHAKEELLDFEKPVLKDNESVTRLGVLVTLLVSLLVTVGSFLHILCFTKSDYGEPGNILPF